MPVALDADWTSLLKVTLDHFYGIEIDEWPARIAETAMFLIDRQCDLRMKERFGVAPERLPIQKAATIVVGNALKLPWQQILAARANVIVAGNPPFSGRHTRTKEQAVDLAAAWGVKNAGHLDYVTAWYAIASKYLAGAGGDFAFVSTNSVTQGEPVALMFPRILDAGWRIKFAHRAFAWTSEATGKATVHCVILASRNGRMRSSGYSTTPGHWAAPRGFQSRLTSTRTWSTARRLLLASVRGNRWRQGCPRWGTAQCPMTADTCCSTTSDVAEVQSDPIASRYLRRYVGAAELIQGIERWCLWLADLDPADVKRSALLKSRIDTGRLLALRARTRTPSSVRQPLTYFGSSISHQRPTSASLKSSLRTGEWVTAARLGRDVIANNRVYPALTRMVSPSRSSAAEMFLAWQKTVGGRRDARYNFSGTIVWNNFRLPT